MTIKDKMIEYLKGKGWVEKKVLAKGIGQTDVSNLSRNIKSSPGTFETKKDGKKNMIRLAKGERKVKGIKKVTEKLRRLGAESIAKKEKEKAIPEPAKEPKNALMIKGVHASFGSPEKAERFKESHERNTDQKLIIKKEELSSGTPIYRLYKAKAEPKEDGRNAELEKEHLKEKAITPEEAGKEVKELVKAKKKPAPAPKKIIEVHPEVEKKVIAGVSMQQLRAVKRGKSQLKDLINEFVLNLPVRKVDYKQYGMTSPQEYRTYLLSMIDLLRKSDGSWIKSNIRVKNRQIEMD